MPKYIINRPVNALRRIFEPSFLGAKIVADESTPLQERILEGSTRKKLHSTEDWAYRNFQVFKGFDEEGNAEYRECLAPSPSTAAAEAFLLNDLAEIADKIRLKNVYSYKLAEKGASVNYVYFLSQYLRRNVDILESLERASDSVAVCFDIKSFYPSVNKNLLSGKLIKFNDDFSKLKNLTPFIDFALDQIAKSVAGIPIGTELSHQLSDIYLREFDKTLQSKYGNNYFRYVDDLTVVCARGDVANVTALVEEELRHLGLRLNEKKSRIYYSHEWRGEIENAAVDGEDFFQFCERLAPWIQQKNLDVADLKRQFQNEGLNLPVEKIAVRKWIRPNVDAVERSTDEVVRETLSLKKKYKAAAEDLVGVVSDEGGKGMLQKARRALNPLFYLLDISEYDLIKEVASSHVNLSTQRIVSEAMTGDSIVKLLSYPGSTVNSFCEITKTVNSKYSKLPNQLNLSNLKSHELDAVTALALHGFVEDKKIFDSEEFLRYLRPNVASRSPDLLGFEKEIESLRISLSEAAQNIILENRNSEAEEINMQALELGDQMISP